jgi:hypothetical protein
VICLGPLSRVCILITMPCCNTAFSVSANARSDMELRDWAMLVCELEGRAEGCELGDGKGFGIRTVAVPALAILPAAFLFSKVAFSESPSSFADLDVEMEAAFGL